MAKTHCFTSATFAYLDRVLVLHSTIKKFHPSWEFWLCLVDKSPPEIDADSYLSCLDHVIHAEDLEIKNFKSWAFTHDIVELCTAVKGAMLEHILALGDTGKVFYLDPDIALFAPLLEAQDLLEENDIILTPHQLSPEDDRQAIIDNEIGSMKFGIYNLGFLGIKNSAEGRRFAAWWNSRLRDFCYDDVSNGLFTDQKWCDHVPALFDKVVILKHCGYNVASWNLSKRRISIDVNGTIFAGELELKFFHFTKVNKIGEAMLERYCNDAIEVFELLAWYRRCLKSNEIVDLPEGWWAYGLYENGIPILDVERKYYRDNLVLKSQVQDPFAAEQTIKNFIGDHH